MAEPPTLPELMVEVTALNTSAAIFPNIFNLPDIMLTLLVGAAADERSFTTR